MGTLLALVVVFWRDGCGLLRHATPSTHRDRATLLAAGPGFAPRRRRGRTARRQAAGYFNDKYLRHRRDLSRHGHHAVSGRSPDARALRPHDLGWQQALWIGGSQAVALIPGVSRAGATMTMGRALGLAPRDRGPLFIPDGDADHVWGGLAEAAHLASYGMTPPFWLGIGLAFGVGLFAINVLLRFLQHRGNSFLPFALYRVALATVIVLKRTGERARPAD